MIKPRRKATPQEKLSLLRRLNLFDDMNESEIESISQQLTMRHCDTGNTIYSGGATRIYLLKTGRVRLYRLSPEGEEVTTAIIGPGQMFGMTSLFGEAPEVDQAQALEESYVCEATAPDFLGMLARHPIMMAKVMITLAHRIFSLESAVDHLVNDTVANRLARILALDLEQGEHNTEGVLLPHHTREELATQINTTRESVSRALSNWKNEGIIDTRGHRILVINRALLVAKTYTQDIDR